MLLPLISHAAILPPVNNTCEPVISPLDLKIKASFELVISAEFILKPPISPVVDFTKPAFVTLNGALANVP